MSWRRRRGGWWRGRAGPGRRRARCDRERPPAWRQARRNRTLLLELCQQRLRGRRVRTFRRQLQIRIELGGRARQVPLVDERHAELIVRLGVIRIRLNGALEGFRGAGNLAGVPENDALVI